MATLTVAAIDQDMRHGDAVPTRTYLVSSSVDGDTGSLVFGSPSLSTTATSSSAAGFYPIAVAAGSLAAANYAFTDLVPATLTAHPNKVLDMRRA
jgi:hypothetical protein